MPANNSTSFVVEQVADIEADTILAVSPVSVFHYYTESEITRDENGDPMIPTKEDGTPIPASGNIEVGDTLVKNSNGDFLKSEKFAVSYIATKGTEVTKIAVRELTIPEIISMLTANPSLRADMKKGTYDALVAAGIVPAGATVS